MIDIEKHKVYVDSLKMDMVPYSVALEIIAELYKISKEQEEKIENAIQVVESAIEDLSKEN